LNCSIFVIDSGPAFGLTVDDIAEEDEVALVIGTLNPKKFKTPKDATKKEKGPKVPAFPVHQQQ
jgi:hypothetical protein